MDKNILEFFNILIIIILFSLIGFSVTLADISIQNNFDFGGNYGILNLKNLQFIPGSTAPQITGMIYYDTAENTLKLWNNSSWVTLGTGSETLHSVASRRSTTTNVIGVAVNNLDTAYGLTVGYNLDKRGIKVTGDSYFEGATADASTPALSVVNALWQNLLYVRSDGSIGVGTASPDSNYKITTTGAGIKAESSIIGQPAGYFSNSSGYALLIGSGNVGIGTTTPTEKLQVLGNTNLEGQLKGIKPSGDFCSNNQVLKYDSVSNNWVCKDGDVYYCSSQTEIEVALTDIGTGGGTIILGAGTFELTNTIDIDGGGSYVIQGQGDSTIIDLGGDRAAFNITSAKSCTIRDLKIDARDTTSEGRDVIDIDEASNNTVIIENITITGDADTGRGIHIRSDNVVITDCHIKDLYVGLRIESDYVRVIGCYFDGNLVWRGVDLREDFNVVEGCVFNGVLLYIDWGNNHSISGNTFKNSDVILSNQSNYNSITGNSFSDARMSVYDGCDYNNISANSFTGSPGGYISVAYIKVSSNGNTISGNMMSNNPDHGYGIFLSYADYNSINGNTISNFSLNYDWNYAGIGIENDSDYNTVSGNTIYNLTNNYSSLRTCCGIQIDDYDKDCDENTVVGNTIFNTDADFSDWGKNTFDVAERDSWTGDYLLNNYNAPALPF